MATSELIIEQAYQDFSQLSLSTSGNNADFVAALQKLCVELGRLLESLPPKQFARAWVLHSVAQDLLKYSIEDDLVDLAPIRRSAAARLAALANSHDWMNDALEQSVQICRELASRTPLRTQHVIVETSAGGELVQVKGRVPSENEPQIQVSTQSFDFVPLLEDSLADPRLATMVVSAFSRQLRELQEKERISCLCFIEKDVGPVGAISMLSSLVEATGLPASIYRSSHWTKRAQVAAYQPTPHDRVALVYDLLVTGDGITQAAKDLLSRYDVHVSAVVVLFGFGVQRDELTFDGHRLKVRALGWYENVAEELKAIKQGQVAQTEHVKTISDAWSRKTPALDRRSAPTVKENGGNKMGHPNGNAVWKPHLNFYPYSELRAISFVSDADLDKALDLIWSRSELFGLPRQAVDERTLIVPKDAVAFFNGLKFELTEVISAGDLTSAERRRLIQEQGQH